MLTDWARQAGSVGSYWTWSSKSEKQSMLGHPGAIRMILLHGESRNFSTSLPKMAAGGKECASTSSHGMLSASTAVAR